MIKFKIKEMLLAAGKPNPAHWLMTHCGFSRGKAYKIVNAKQKSLQLEDLSILVQNLICTPNDLLYWEQTKRHTLPPGHPCMVHLKTPHETDNWNNIFKNLSPEKMMEVHNFALEKLKEQ